MSRFAEEQLEHYIHATSERLDKSEAVIIARLIALLKGMQQ
jgi:hypothetical protein